MNALAHAETLLSLLRLTGMLVNSKDRSFNPLGTGASQQPTPEQAPLTALLFVEQKEAQPPL
jgi:hypothetical protein